MLKIFIFSCLMILQASAHQKQTLNEFSSGEKDRLFGVLATLGAPVNKVGKCNLTIACKNTANCNAVTTAITNAPNAQVVSNALSSSCLALCVDATACRGQQFAALTNWLHNYNQQQAQQEIDRQKGKKRGYKQRVNDLERQLTQATQDLNDIDGRLDGYLQHINIVPNADPDVVQSINLKLTQLFDDSRGLRAQIINLEGEILAREQEIARLQQEALVNQAEIARLQEDVLAKQQEIGVLQGQIDDLRRRFSNLLDSTIDLEAIVSDFGLDLNGYADRIRGLNGELAIKIEQLRVLTDGMRADVTGQTDDRRQHYERLIGRLNLAIDGLNEQLGQTQADYDEMREILSRMG